MNLNIVFNNSKIDALKHPSYSVQRYKNYRNVLLESDEYIDTYLEKFSSRERPEKFAVRKRLTYNPARVKMLLTEIANMISSRLCDVKRYHVNGLLAQVISGQAKGVDLKSNSLNMFLDLEIIPELLAMGRVGIYVDRDSFVGLTKRDGNKNIPYLIPFRAEDIISWRLENGVYVSLLLRVNTEKIDPVTSLTTGYEGKYYLFNATEKGVVVRVFNEESNKFDSYAVLDIPQIPFYMFEIKHSVLEDVYRHQIALLNLASSDLSYALNSNFTFYVEQVDFRTQFMFTKSVPDPQTQGLNEGVSGDGYTKYSSSCDVEAGPTDGRLYGKGLERPGFIHPSSEPLEASMSKQAAICAEIKELMFFNIQNLASNASEDSKEYTDRGFEAGLTLISEKLCQGEYFIDAAYSMYEGTKTKIVVTYPKLIVEKALEKRLDIAERIIALSTKIQSMTYIRAMLKEAARLSVNVDTDIKELQRINSEIDNVNVIITEHEDLISDLEAGLVGVEFASKLRGYPEGQVEQAKKDHAERAARIALAQSKANQQGVSDLDNNTNNDKKGVKSTQQDAALNKKGVTKQVRGGEK